MDPGDVFTTHEVSRDSFEQSIAQKELCFASTVKNATFNATISLVPTGQAR